MPPAFSPRSTRSTALPGSKAASACSARGRATGARSWLSSCAASRACAGRAAPTSPPALAAPVAVVAPRLLSAFDATARLARLEGAVRVLGEGSSDWRAVLAQLLRRLEGVLRPRSAHIALAVRGESFEVGIADADAQQ